jgi:WD40 repeat protein
MAVHEMAALPHAPYCGIRPFRFADREIFFAREQEAERLTSLVSVYRGVMLHGASGTGKSSLVNAGLLPRAVQHGFQPERVRVQPRRGGELVVERIAASDGDDAWLPSLLAGEDERSSRVVLSTEAFEQRVEEACAQQRTLLVFDQFEELCTLFETRDDCATRERILDLVARLMRGPLPVKLLFVFRDDYLGRVKQLLAASPELVDHALRLSPLSAEALPAIIRGPFERHASHYDHELGPRLAAQLGAAFADRFGSGDLALSEVQTVCLRLWQAEDPERLLAQQGVQGLLEAYLGEALDSFPAALRFAAVAVLAQMVTAAGTRNVVSADDVVQRVCEEDPNLSPQLVQHALARLEHESRLVRREHRRDLELYEITSEFLVPWISERRAGARRLREHQRERRRLLLLGGVAAALALVAAVVAVLAGWALHQRDDARRAARVATGLALATASVTERGERLDVPLLFALGAYDAQRGPQALDALVTALHDVVGIEGILHGHAGPVSAVAIDRSGRLVASAGDDHAIRLWSVATNRPVGPPLRGNESGVDDVAFSPDGRTLASAGADGTLRLWSVAAHRQLGRPLWRSVKRLSSVAFSGDGRLLAAAGAAGELRLWDVRRRRQVGRPMRVPRAVRDVAVGGGGGLVAAASDDGAIRLWSVATQRLVGRPLAAHAGIAEAVAFSRDGTRLVSGWQDGAVRLWDVAAQRQIGSSLRGHRDVVSDVAFSPDGRTVLSSSWDRTLREWSAATGAQVGQPFEELTSAALGLALSRDGQLVASANRDGTVRLWRLHGPHGAGTPLRESGRRTPIADVAFAPDGRLLAAAGRDAAVRLWDVRRGRRIGRPLRAGARLEAVAFSPDGATLAAAGDDGAIHLWRLPRGTPAGVLRDDGGAVTAVAFGPGGRLLASAGSDGAVRLWHVAQRRPLAPLRGRSGDVQDVAFAPDGRLLATAGEDGAIRLWSVARGAQVGVLRGHTGRVMAVAFSADGRLLASAGVDDSVRLWDVARGREVGSPMTDHKTNVLDVAISPRGDAMASVADDGSLRLWNVAYRTPLGPVMAAADVRGDAVQAVAFSPDGTTLASGDHDGTVRLWEGFLFRRFADVRRSACRVVGGDLSRAEWSRYLPGLAYRRVCERVG